MLDETFYTGLCWEVNGLKRQFKLTWVYCQWMESRGGSQALIRLDYPATGYTEFSVWSQRPRKQERKECETLTARKRQDCFCKCVKNNGTRPEAWWREPRQFHWASTLHSVAVSPFCSFHQTILFSGAITQKKKPLTGYWWQTNSEILYRS